MSQDRFCVNCSQKLTTDNLSLFCPPCGEENIKSYINLPKEFFEENRRRIYGRDVSDEELLKIIQQQGEED